jgi:hypothetical protein|tara:strand:+ start:479 stop:736 length:258 start_codon:yes stop_codon:yes gene_type:complete
VSDVEGWEGLEIPQNETAKADDVDILYGRLFKSEEGQKVLSHLRGMTIEQPTWYPGEDAAYGYVRTGMAEIVRMIEKRVTRSENV